MYNKLSKIIYTYYPKSIDCIKDKENYLNSKEYKRLNDLIKLHTIKPIEIYNELKKSLSNLVKDIYSFNDITYFEWQDRCYTFEYNFSLEKYNEKLKVYISILNPVYTIKFFKYEVNRFREHSLEEAEVFDENFIFKIEKTLKIFRINKVESNILNKKIVDVNFDDIRMGNFTFYNAFFNSQNF